MADSDRSEARHLTFCFDWNCNFSEVCLVLDEDPVITYAINTGTKILETAPWFKPTWTGCEIKHLFS